jgi:hypothetical protein
MIIREIIIHCSATREGQDISADDIRGWHKAKGWSDIGYHYIISLDGTIAKGREDNIPGAHCTLVVLSRMVRLLKTRELMSKKKVWRRY